MEFQLRTKKEKRNNAILWASIPAFFVLMYVALLIFDSPETSEDKYETIMLGVLIGIMVVLSPLIYKSARNLEGYSNAKVVLGDEGAEFFTAKKNVFMPWNDIAYVVLIKAGRKYQIGFFTANYYSEATKMPYSLYPTQSMTKITDANAKMAYSQEAMEIIKKHFKQPITNEYILYLKEGSTW